MTDRSIISLFAVAAGLFLGAISSRGIAQDALPPMPPAPVAVAPWPAQDAHVAYPSLSLLEISQPTVVACDTLVEYALANNPEIQAARYQARALGARVPQAVSLPDPQLQTIAFLQQIQTAAGPQEVAMSLAQKFPWFGKRALRSEVAYHGAQAAYARATATELKVIEQVKRAYFDVYFLQSAYQETKKLEPRLRDVVEIAKVKYENNVANTGLEDVLQAQVELSKVKTDLIKLEQTKRQAQARLARVLHLPPQTPIDAESSIRRSRLAETAKLLVELAESYQPELDARRREYTRDQTSIDLARRDYWPDVTVALSWIGTGSTGLSPIATGEDAFALGVGVNLPIYRKRLDAAVREARYKTCASASRYEATRDQVRSEVQSLYAQFQEQHQILVILEREILPRAAQTFELSIESFRTGRQDFQQLIDTYRTLLNYRVDLHRRQSLREQAIASLERAVGCAITGDPTEAGVDITPIPEPPSRPIRP